MRRFLLIILLLPLTTDAHPGVGIVKDSRGNIYYTDLRQVWKITNEKKTLAVPNVHSHELYVDLHDNLYGEGGYYDDKANKFYHYLWVYRPDGRIDTVIGMKEQYLHQDFSLAKDRKGNEYYIKRFLVANKDTVHIYRKTTGGQETVYATGNFRNVNWLHPQDDGSLLYVSNNAIYSVDTLGIIKLVKEYIGSTKPSFKFSGKSITIWGVWQDNKKNIYAAVFSDQSVKKIDEGGDMTVVYTSKGNWAPLHGILDNNNRLWVLESSDNNDVRVTLVESIPITIKNTFSNNVLTYIMVSCIMLGIAIIYVTFRKLMSANIQRVKIRLPHH